MIEEPEEFDRKRCVADIEAAYTALLLVLLAPFVAVAVMSIAYLLYLLVAALA
jgi:hypothetical protein